MTTESTVERGVTPIDIAFPDSPDRHLRLQVGACRLLIKPGAGDRWVRGVYRDPAEALPPRIIYEGGTVRITQDWHPARWPLDGPATFDLALGTAQPYALSLETGATEATFDLGGLPLTRLSFKQGAGKNTVDFSAPNPQPMSLLELSAGAVGMELKNLANANAAELRIEGGAAAYKFDFGGKLQRNTNVKISTGLSSVEITIPSGTAAKISSESFLGGIDIGDGFTKKDGAFWNTAALGGGAPVLTIHANVSIGSLKLRGD